MLFFLDRAKDRSRSGRRALAWSRAILLAYLKRFGAELMEATPLFWTRGGGPVSSKGKSGQWGGDHGGGRAYRAAAIYQEFAEPGFAAVCELAFGKGEKRRLQDMWRSGAVKGDADGAAVAD